MSLRQFLSEQKTTYYKSIKYMLIQFQTKICATYKAGSLEFYLLKHLRHGSVVWLCIFTFTSQEGKEHDIICLFFISFFGIHNSRHTPRPVRIPRAFQKGYLNSPLGVILVLQCIGNQRTMDDARIVKLLQINYRGSR